MTKTTPRADAPAVIIRRATADDAEALARLRWEFRAGIGQVDKGEDAFVARCTAWMRARLAEGGAWRAWVAEAHGEIAGNVWMQMIEKMPNPVHEPEVHGYVTDLYVRPSARGGVGGRLLAAALGECAAAGVHHAFLWPTERSRPLYRRLGFTGEGEVMVWVNPVDVGER